MLNKYKRFLLLLLPAVLSLTLNAQKIISSSGTAQIRLEGNITEDQTYQLAEQQAKIDAIENAFGTYTEQQTDMTIKDGTTSYDIIGTTRVWASG